LSVVRFFINPVLSEFRPGQCLPYYFDFKCTKLSAGWLIDHSGFPPGYGHDWSNGKVALSSRHALAVDQPGWGTAADIMKFAAHIREGVESPFPSGWARSATLNQRSF